MISILIVEAVTSTLKSIAITIQRQAEAVQLSFVYLPQESRVKNISLGLAVLHLSPQHEAIDNSMVFPTDILVLNFIHLIIRY